MNSDQGESIGQQKAALREIFERARGLLDVSDSDVHIVELLSLYLKFNPNHGIAWFDYGDALRAVGRLQEAEEALLKAVDLAPKARRFAVYARIGMVVGKRGSPSDAEKWYRVATSEPGCPGWMWCMRGANLLRTEALRLAKTCLETALVSEDVVKEEVLLNLALLARVERRYEDARGYLRDALAIEPGYVEATRVMQSLVGIEETVEYAALAAERFAAAAE